MRRCDALLQAWCHAHCPLAREHGPLYARRDRAHEGGAGRAWRCYAAATLDESRTRFVGGTAYCTRDSPLRKVLELCLAAERSPLDEGGTPLVVSVNERGEAQQIAPPQMMNARGEARVGLVVAHCHEEMRWLAQVHRGLHEGAGTMPLRLELYIYEKCQNSSKGEWNELRWEVQRRASVVNKGEECYAYLTYMTSYYSSLPDVVLFFQGDGVLDGRDFYAKTLAFSKLVFGHGQGPRPDLWRSVNDHQYIALASDQSECAARGIPNCFAENKRQFHCATLLYERATEQKAPPVWAVYANAQFGVTRDRLVARPLSFYRQLLDEFEVDSSAECFKIQGHKGRPFRGTCALFEYLWPSFLGESHVLEKKHTMSPQK